ncbi:MAG: hypothetical protein H0V32_05895 [Nocardioidaceae bacterium]|nr:hypothetical protein [Nocardioidaceae bacterium]
MSNRSDMGVLAMVTVTVAGTLILVGLRPADSQPAGTQSSGTKAANTVPVQQRAVTCFGLPGHRSRSTIAVNRSTWWTRSVPAGDSTIAASGSTAVDLTAFSAVTPDRAVGAGLAVQRCAEPARRWWFVGAASTASRSGTLLLRAPDDTDAVTDVTLRGPDGVLDTVGTDDVRVAAGTTVRLPLTDLVAGAKQVAIEVDTSRGTVMAALAETRADSSDPTGTEWLPPTAAPAETVLVPGVGGSGGASAGGKEVLVLANAAERTVAVRPVLVTDAGRAVLPDLSAVQVPGGGTAAVPLPPNIGPGSTIELRAQAPISAAVRVVADNDIAIVVGAAALSESAVLPVDLGARVEVDPATTLTLSALLVDPESQDVRSRTVEVRALDAAGDVVATGEVEINAGTSLAVDLAGVLRLSRSQTKAVSHVVVRARRAGTTGDISGDTSGAPVVASFAARAAKEANGIATMPLSSLNRTITVTPLIPRVSPAD